MNPMSEENYRIQGLILTLLGDYAEAERTLREGLTFASPGTTFTKVTLAYALARGGDKTMARQVTEELLEKRKHDYVSPVELAMLYIALGERQTAIKWCETAVEERRGWVGYLAVHPLVDSLRNEPGFGELLHKLGLAEIRAAT
jgi:Flp pilus assembly protein TadD